MACTRVAHAYPCVDDTYGTDFGCHTRIAGFLRRKGIVGVLAMLDPLCTKGDSRSCQMLGGFLGIFSSQRHENADAKIFGYYERGCEIGDQDACRAAPYTANRLFDEATKTSKLRRLAEREIAIKEQNCLRFGECGWVARSYLAGEGVVADAAKARGYFARTCAYGFEGPGYCLDLAELQAAGKGGPVNAEAARKVYEKECSVMMDGGALESYQYENMAHGCRGLARLYQEGLGVPKDEKPGQASWQKAFAGNSTSRLCASARGSPRSASGSTATSRRSPRSALRMRPAARCRCRRRSLGRGRRLSRRERPRSRTRLVRAPRCRRGPSIAPRRRRWPRARLGVIPARRLRISLLSCRGCRSRSSRSRPRTIPRRPVDGSAPRP